MASPAAPYLKLPSLRLVKRAIVRYVLSLVLLIFPAALTAVILAQGNAFNPVISALSLADVFVIRSASVKLCLFFGTSWSNVKRYGGCIGVDSELGKASILYFSVPDGTSSVGRA
jgi:hypothetical protein